MLYSALESQNRNFPMDKSWVLLIVLCSPISMLMRSNLLLDARKKMENAEALWEAYFEHSCLYNELETLIADIYPTSVVSTGKGGNSILTSRRTGWEVKVHVGSLMGESSGPPQLLLTAFCGCWFRRLALDGLVSFHLGVGIPYVSKKKLQTFSFGEIHAWNSYCDLFVSPKGDGIWPYFSGQKDNFDSWFK